MGKTGRRRTSEYERQGEEPKGVRKTRRKETREWEGQGEEVRVSGKGREMRKDERLGNTGSRMKSDSEKEFQREK